MCDGTRVSYVAAHGERYTGVIHGKLRTWEGWKGLQWVASLRDVQDSSGFLVPIGYGITVDRLTPWAEPAPGSALGLVEEAERLDAAATPGPWKAQTYVSDPGRSSEYAILAECDQMAARVCLHCMSGGHITPEHDAAAERGEDVLDRGALTAERDALRAALVFYADKANHYEHWSGDVDVGAELSKVMCDGGALARAALATKGPTDAER